ncbi:hypothetical protein RhiirA5_415404 [Rhizophagus irregularis]|uniref:Uncharacterized protein n=2 Tax=Rhizophagus irregularis TaxID=588596 RepID=A0A2I1E7D6_9GLOM|nr:hypothetical protein RhiirA5_415404 [Rhizophagus irregularis]PKC73398.1 hypothetical protein RhiirA1_451195 [Rhizophagus irregularis]PKK78209.1 hypothetical protein RhiirC2_770425 [Rhizophagus irregularis]PKY18031.1 hypothetical protein RhiirB3_430756 [Rhizophagus irregularis]
MQIRNGFKKYAHNLHSIVRYIDNMKDKFENTIEKPITWLNNNEEAEKDKYDNRKKLLEEIVQSNSDVALCHM